ncbi:MAG: glycosyltransferase family 4 protein [Gemmatimonadota bacterium]
MRVLYIVTAYDRRPGDGITPWLVQTIDRLAARGVEVEVLAPSYRGLASGRVNDVMVHRFRYAPARLEALTHDQTAADRVRERPAYLALVPGFLAAAAAAAARVSRDGDFDLVHVHWPLPMAIPGLAARRAAGIPMVCSFYGVELTVARSAPVPFLVPFLRHVIRSADAVTAISNYTAGLVKALYERPVEIIPFGATTPVPDAPPPLDPAPPLRLLFVGRLVERKGVHYLLDAVARARDRVQLAADIVGRGPEKSALEARAAELGVADIVTFHGHVSDDQLIRHYERADVFVLPAAFDEKGDVEGLGVVLIEAMAYGRPAIASDAGGIPDIVRHGENGLLVPPGDAEALAAAIESLALDPARVADLGRRGREYVAERFGWPSVIGSLEALYARLTRAR